MENLTIDEKNKEKIQKNIVNVVINSIDGIEKYNTAI